MLKIASVTVGSEQNVTQDVGCHGYAVTSFCHYIDGCLGVDGYPQHVQHARICYSYRAIGSRAPNSHATFAGCGATDWMNC